MRIMSSLNCYYGNVWNIHLSLRSPSIRHRPQWSISILYRGLKFPSILEISICTISMQIFADQISSYIQFQSPIYTVSIYTISIYEISFCTVANSEIFIYTISITKISICVDILDSTEYTSLYTNIENYFESVYFRDHRYISVLVLFIFDLLLSYVACFYD